jgi:type II secretory pathway component PulC
MWDMIFDSKAKDSLKQKGMSEQDYVRSLLNVEKSLIMKPADTIKKLMEIYKVDPKTLGGGDDEEYVTDIDKTIKEMRAELASLKNEKTQTKEQNAAQEQAFIAKQIRDFEFAIDESGESKYPLFKEVRDEMGIFIQNGKAKTLEEAYEMSPTVKESKLEAKKNLQSREDIEAEKQAVAKAKKAAKGVTNKQIVTQDSRKMSFEERFAEKLRKAKAG